MIHVISAANRHLYEDAIESQFRLRHDIFVGERGWKALARPDRREVDAYDNEDSAYLLAMEGRRVVGGHRLYPTLKPTMLAEVFPHLAAVRGVPCDPLIWEWCRYFIVKERREGKLAFELLAAIQEFCLDEGIIELSGAMETWWLPRFQEAGFVVVPLGLPAIVENAWTLASKVVISADTLEHVRALGNVSGSVLVREGPQLSIVDRALRLHRRAATEGTVFKGIVREFLKRPALPRSGDPHGKIDRQIAKDGNDESARTRWCSAARRRPACRDASRPKHR